jgi:hypothetical protein
MTPRGFVMPTLALIVGLCGCREAPTQPTHLSHDPATVLRPPACAPVLSEVHCTVRMWIRNEGEVDVTALATWYAADSNLSDGLTPSSVAKVSSPGRITPVQPGNVSIHVRYLADHTTAPHSYAVDRAAPAVALAPCLMGFVSEADGTTPIEGALVEIIDGAGMAGRSDTTRVNGYYFIEHVRMATPMEVRASKAGYVTSVGTHPGITDDALGYPYPSFLHFRLSRIPAG